MFKKWIDKLSGNTPDAATEEDKPETKPEEPRLDDASAPTGGDGEPETAISEEKKDLTYIESAGPAEAGDAAAPATPVDKETIQNRVVDMMKTIYDPEIPVNIYDIGLIYKIEPRDDGIVELIMTLTTPNCPAAGILPGEVESKARSVEGVRDVEFELTFDPPWNPDMMSEGAKLELGMM